MSEKPHGHHPEGGGDKHHGPEKHEKKEAHAPHADHGNVASKSHGGKESPMKVFFKELAKDIYEIGNFSDLITFTAKIAQPIALDTAKSVMTTPAKIVEESMGAEGGAKGHH